MTSHPQSKATLLTDLMLAVFRVNGRLLEKGDQLVEGLNLTSARWQALGAVALAEKSLSAPQIAEAMGITRQGAQKQLNKLEQDGFFAQAPNPRHLRSPVYALTELGERTFAKAMVLETAWAKSLVADLALQDLKSALQTLNAVHEVLNAPVPIKGAKS